MAADTLPPMQQRFVCEYLIDLDGQAAAIRAGYKPHAAAQQASRLLRNVKIKTAIAEKQAKIERKTIATAAERREWWSEVMRGSEKINDRLRASELLGKSQGDFVEKLEIRKPDELDDMSDDELDNLRATVRRRIAEAEAAGISAGEKPAGPPCPP